MSLRACFLDVDGVILDPAVTPREWERLIGEVLAPALGGEVADWGHANREVFPSVWERRADWYHDDPIVTERQLGTLIIQAEARLLDARVPDAEEAWRLSRQLDLHVGEHARSAFPASTAVIRDLARDFELHTATGNPSWRIEPMLAGLGVREHFGVLCGPDLIGVMKDTTGYYQRLLERAGVAPHEAVIIDDSPRQLEVAASLGARTVLVGLGAHGDGIEATAAGIEDVPAVVRALAG